ncbi:MAG TPA: hypothetical protein VFH63_04675 [candidate division Zixibacteria bacterium]|nr:hypothetical protein [candidate division Zixibacteria bacterium]
MTFWNWRRGSGATTSNGSSAMAMAAELAPIELYTADARIVAWIAANGRRVTDLLNEQDELRLWRPSPGPLDAGTTADNSRMPTSVRDAPPRIEETGEWQSLVTDQVILAMPPEWRASRQLRLHRKLRRVAMSAGPFSVTGNLHLSPGAEPTMDLLLRAPRFMPLTEAYILHNGEPPFEHVVSVVIVNTRMVTQLVPLVTLA